MFIFSFIRPINGTAKDSAFNISCFFLKAFSMIFSFFLFKAKMNAFQGPKLSPSGGTGRGLLLLIIHK